MSQPLASGSPLVTAPAADHLPRQAVPGQLALGDAPTATEPAQGLTASLTSGSAPQPAPRPDDGETPVLGWSPTAWRSGR